MLQIEVRDLAGWERWGILQTTCIIWIVCSEPSLTVTLLGILKLDKYMAALEVCATGKGLALKVIQQNVLTF